MQKVTAVTILSAVLCFLCRMSAKSIPCFYVICDSTREYCDNRTEDCAPCKSYCLHVDEYACREKCPDYILHTTTVTEKSTTDAQTAEHVTVVQDNMMGGGTEHYDISIPAIILVVLLATIIVAFMVYRMVCRARTHQPRQQQHRRGPNQIGTPGEQVSVRFFCISYLRCIEKMIMYRFLLLATNKSYFPYTCMLLQKHSSLDRVLDA